MGTLSGWWRNVDVPGNRSRSWLTMSVAMRSDVNGLVAMVADAFFSSDDDGVDAKLGHDGVDDAGDDEALAPGPLTLLLLLLLALRSSG